MARRKNLEEKTKGKRKSQVVRAIVLDVVGPRMSVRLCGNGAKLFGIRYSGGPISSGAEVNVDYSSGQPIASGIGEEYVPPVTKSSQIRPLKVDNDDVPAPPGSETEEEPYYAQLFLNDDSDTDPDPDWYELTAYRPNTTIYHQVTVGSASPEIADGYVPWFYYYADSSQLDDLPANYTWKLSTSNFLQLSGWTYPQTECEFVVELALYKVEVVDGDWSTASSPPGDNWTMVSNGYSELASIVYPSVAQVSEVSGTLTEAVTLDDNTRLCAVFFVRKTVDSGISGTLTFRAKIDQYAGPYLEIGSNPSSYSLNDLQDVNIDAPGEGQVLAYGADGRWINETLDIPETLLDLTDTPSDYTDKAGFYARVNSGSSGIEFVESVIPEDFTDLDDVPSSYDGAGGYDVRVTSGADGLEFVEHESPIEEFTGLTDTPSSFLSHALDVLRVNAGEDAVEFYTLSIPSSFTDLDDVPTDYSGEASKLLAVNETEDGIVFVSASSGGAGGATDFTDLEDVPESYTDQAAKMVVVNATEDGLEFQDQPTIPSELPDLDDFPTDYSGYGGYLLAVNGSEDGVEFVSASSGGGASDFTDLGDVPSSYSGQGGKLVAVNSGETGLEFVSASSGGGGGGGVQQAIITFSGPLRTITNPLRIYNATGSARTISKVFICIGTVASGQAVIVDVLRNGSTSLFASEDRPSITAASNTAESTTFVSDAWADGDYMVARIDQIGAGESGKDLTVHIVYE